MLTAINTPTSPSMWTDNLLMQDLRPAAEFFPCISLVRRITATGDIACPGKLLLVSDKRTSVISNADNGIAPFDEKIIMCIPSQ